MRLAAAHSGPGPSHVCKPRSIFAEVHAPGKNDYDSFAAVSAKLCEAFCVA